ncbi:PopZ family protein [Wolbachia endosymbiont of Cantharis cryptica]|uniref:PopZ family protein n=1 Tax=Wolbachia endosymbiont of Cantharis cryptica TaxID=3066132 RepID=UPI00376F2A09
MNDEQGNQSVKDILEDIKKAISGKNASDDEVEIEKEEDVLYLEKENEEDDDVLYLEKECFENSEEDSKEQENKKKDINNDDQSEEIIFNNTQFNIHSHNLGKEKDVRLHNNTQTGNNKVNNSSLQAQNNDHLILKENMEEIKALLGKMQNELQNKQQKKVNLTVEELITSLLKPQLSEWLNKYLHTLVKEVVEKELKDIINNK